MYLYSCFQFIHLIVYDFTDKTYECIKLLVTKMVSVNIHFLFMLLCMELVELRKKILMFVQLFEFYTLLSALVYILGSAAELIRGSSPFFWTVTAGSSPVLGSTLISFSRFSWLSENITNTGCYFSLI